MKRALTIISLLGLHAFAFAQPKPEIVEYIDKYKDIAIEEMVRTKIPASITLAQGLLESGFGKSVLALKTNNHFGIKCKEEWAGNKFHYDDDAPGECFRVYTTVRESYADHSDFLTGRSRYASLFTLNLTDYKAWAIGLKTAGYATNPKYADILIKHIEEYELHAYDKVGQLIIQNNIKNPLPVQAQVAKQETNNSVPTEHYIREEYLVNGIRAVRSKENEEPFSVAFEYNIDYAHVLAFNDLASGEKFTLGENVFLQPKKSKGEANTYVVQKGENMRSISQKLGIKLKDLYYKNLMQANDQALTGEALFLQSKRASAPATLSYADYLKSLTSVNQQPAFETQTAAPNSTAAYEVQQKETLYSIAKKFNTTVDKIRELNGIEADSIKAGQTLVVKE